ncbi:hypothetical protein MAR_031936 [Mya arenaria]|uniref:Ig-like domain-containing protein n=1 Tax=Mya arenaria TaxID=6604 RepID=A0ABY7F6U8_MYAAR|nr:hypothetical protein MAR_031936 [Mya arenaria]
MWNDMFLLKLLVLFFRLLSTEGKELKLWMFPEVVNEFQPLTLICDVEEVNETWIVDWIRNKTGTTELHLESPCASAMNSTEDYTISCLTNQQHNLTINNVTRLNHGDLWHCRDRNNTKYQSNGVVVQVRVVPPSVEITRPPTDFVTVYEEDEVFFECITSPGYFTSAITWYKVTIGSKDIIHANGSSVTELNDKKRLYRSWLTLAFSIRQDWTVVYCTTNNFMSLSNRVTIHVIKRNGVGDEAKENTSHSTKSSTVNRLTTAVYENTTIGAP